MNLSRLEKPIAVDANEKRISTFCKLISSAVSLSLVLLLLACSSTGETVYNRNENAAGKPNWVADGTRTLTSSKGRAFIAVGSARTIGAEFAMQATKANLRCKDDMREMVARFIAVTSRDYIASGAAEASGFVTQNVDKNIEAITTVAMTAVQVLEHWVDNREKHVYAISELKLSELTEEINENASVHDGFKVFLQKSGQAIFDRIATDHELKS